MMAGLVRKRRFGAEKRCWFSDGHTWEIAYNPFWTIREDGRVSHRNPVSPLRPRRVALIGYCFGRGSDGVGPDI